jgi:hypothetical protein
MENLITITLSICENFDVVGEGFGGIRGTVVVPKI